MAKWYSRVARAVGDALSNTVRGTAPVKTPQELEKERIAAAKAQDDIVAGQVRNLDPAPDPRVKRYNLKDFDRGPFNKAESIYQNQTIQGLKTGKFADVEAAMQRTGRDTALRTSRGQQAGEAAAAAAGFKPGTPEYNRAIEMAVSGAETQNMQDTNAVRQMQRNYYTDAMNRAQGIGDQMYSRATGERGHEEAADALEYSRNDKTYTNKQQDMRDFIAQQPPNIQNKLRLLLAQGKDITTASGIFDATGAIAAPYRGATPAEQSFASQWQEIVNITPRRQGETIENYNARIAKLTRDRLGRIDEAAINPVNEGNRAQNIQNETNKQVEQLAQAGKGFDASSWKILNSTRPDLIKSMPAVTIINTGYAKNVKTGDVINYNGKKYMVANPSYHTTRNNWYGNTRARDGILAYDENGNQVEIAMTKEYDPD